MTAPDRPRMVARQGLIALACGHVRAIRYSEARLFAVTGGKMLCPECPGTPYRAIVTDRQHNAAGRCPLCLEQIDSEGVCACLRGIAARAALAEMLTQLRDNHGPRADDPFDADLWLHDARRLTAQIWPGVITI